MLLHPIGVGLSRYFWHRFCGEWRQTGHSNPIYNPDLLGCGESEMPRIAYTPADWAEQLQYFLQTIVKKPVVLLVQGAELAVALALLQRQTEPNYIQGLVLAGPPAWAVITDETPTWQQKLTWNILDSPVGRNTLSIYLKVRVVKSLGGMFCRMSQLLNLWLSLLSL
jgi:pimeloyl-ACP methyl ester carboxylesterase